MRSLETEEYVLRGDTTPEWYDESMRQVESIRKRLEVANATESALARYAWPLNASEREALTRLSADIAQDASSWRDYTIAVVDASVEVANARIMANEEQVSLMPSSVGKAFELARVVEEGYADNTKEALLYLATENYRNSNLALQAAQLNQLELTRMENAEYMRTLMVQLAGMSLQLRDIGKGIGKVNDNLGEISGQLSGIQGSLDDIEDAAWATASAAQATAANTAQIAESARNIDSNTAATARNTAVTAAATTATAYHARRAADATQDLRDFYAADHPSASPNSSRMRRLGPGERYASGM